MSLEMMTVGQLFAERVRLSREGVALQWLERQGRIARASWAEVDSQVRRFAAGLSFLGIGRGDVVVIQLQPGPELSIALLGAALLGAPVLCLPDSWDADYAEEVLMRVRARVAVVGQRELAVELLRSAERLPGLGRVVGWGACSSVDGVLPFGQLLLKGGELIERDPRSFARALSRVSPKDLALLVPIEGGSRPRLIELDHDHCCFTAVSTARCLGLTQADTTISVPVGGGMTDHLLGVFLRVASGMSTTYTGEGERFQELAQRQSPTILAASAAVFEHALLDVERAVQRWPAWRRRLYGWAIRVGAECARRHMAEQEIGPFIGAQQAIAQRLVLSEVCALFGGRVRQTLLLSGSLSRSARWTYQALGLSPLRVFGRPECFGAALIEPPSDPRPGTLGRPLPETELRISEDGRLWTRGRHVFAGYFGETARPQGVDRQGWLALEVEVELDDEGYVWPLRSLGSVDAPSMALMPISFGDNVGRL